MLGTPVQACTHDLSCRLGGEGRVPASEGRRARRRRRASLRVTALVWRYLATRCDARQHVRRAPSSRLAIIMSPASTCRLLIASILVFSGCDTQPGVDAGDASSVLDTGPDATVDSGDVGCAGPPGLFRPGSCTALADGVRPFQPAHALWTDGAAKERFVYIPPGTRIDATDPDGWVFPVGTRLYKTFSLDGVRLETRLLEKTREGVGFANWEMRAFLWNSAQDAVVESDGELVEDVLGTQHDVPSRDMCRDCHSANRDGVNGFSAIQLAHGGSGVTLDSLNRGELLAPPLSLADARLPGDEATQAALGYLHANCAHCHQSDGPAGSLTGLLLRVEVGLESFEETSTYRSAVDVPGNWVAVGARLRIASGDPEASTIIRRMSSREPAIQMPPLGTEVVDSAGLELVRRWIEGM